MLPNAVKTEKTRDPAKTAFVRRRRRRHPTRNRGEEKTKGGRERRRRERGKKKDARFCSAIIQQAFYRTAFA